MMSGLTNNPGRGRRTTCAERSCQGKSSLATAAAHDAHYDILSELEAPSPPPYARSTLLAPRRQPADVTEEAGSGEGGKSSTRSIPICSPVYFFPLTFISFFFFSPLTDTEGLKDVPAWRTRRRTSARRRSERCPSFTRTSLPRQEECSPTHHSLARSIRSLVRSFVCLFVSLYSLGRLHSLVLD